jgi:hypothetical protein
MRQFPMHFLCMMGSYLSKKITWCWVSKVMMSMELVSSRCIVGCCSLYNQSLRVTRECALCVWRWRPPFCGPYYLVKHFNKLCSIFGGHFISMSILFMKEERHYGYSLKSGRKVHLLPMPISFRSYLLQSELERNAHEDLSYVQWKSTENKDLSM